MATCRDIVTGSLRLLGAYGGGETPTSEDMDTGFIALQSMFDGWLASAMFGRLKDVYKASGYTAKEGERVTAPVGVTLSTPTTITTYGCVRAPRDLACIEFDQNGARTTWLYDRVAWVKINGLTLAGTCPLSDRGQRGLMACLAVLLSSDFGMPVTPSISRQAAQFRGLISQKLGSTEDASAVDYF